jgi:hypothetical protein
MRCFFDPGSGIGKKNKDPDPGSRSGMNIPDHISGSLETIPDLDLLPIPDPGMKKAPDPGSATVVTKANSRIPGSNGLEDLEPIVDNGCERVVMQDKLLQAGQQAHAPHLLKAFYLYNRPLRGFFRSGSGSRKANMAHKKKKKS